MKSGLILGCWGQIDNLRHVVVVLVVSEVVDRFLNPSSSLAKSKRGMSLTLVAMRESRRP